MTRSTRSNERQRGSSNVSFPGPFASLDWKEGGREGEGVSKEPCVLSRDSLDFLVSIGNRKREVGLRR